jgi:hypothetical protein
VTCVAHGDNEFSEFPRLWHRFHSLGGNLDFKRFFRARIQAGTVDSSTCSSRMRDERYCADDRTTSSSVSTLPSRK